MTGKPSAYLADMGRLAAKANLGEDLVRHRFQQALPPTIAPIIATQKTTPLDDLGKSADELCSLANDLTINRVPRPDASSNRTDMRSDTYAPSHISRSQSRDLTPFSSSQRPKICRAHIFFADRAKTCRSWCRWPNKSNCKVTQSTRNTPHASPIASRDGSPSHLNPSGHL